MSILDMNLGDAVEPTVVPADQEYKIRIIDVRVDTDKNGKPYIMPRFELADDPNAKDFTKFLGAPNPDTMDAKKLNRVKWAMSVFLQAFGRDPNASLDTDTLIGEEGWAILGVEESEQYGEQNYVKKFIAPK